MGRLCAKGSSSSFVREGYSPVMQALCSESVGARAGLIGCGLIGCRRYIVSYAS